MDLKGVALRTRNRKVKELEIRQDRVANALTGVRTDSLVCGVTNGTNTQPKSTKSTMENATQQTLPKLKPKKSQTTIYSVLDSLVKRLVSLEKDVDLKTPEGLYFLKSLGLQSTKDPNIYCLKTSRVCLVTTKEKLFRQSLGFSPTWGIELNGRYLIASTLEFPKTGSECSLSDILEKEVDDKYFLSDKMKENLTQKNRMFRQHLMETTTKDQVEGLEEKDGNLYEQTSRIHKKEGISPTVPTASGGHHIPMVQELDD